MKSDRNKPRGRPDAGERTPRKPARSFGGRERSETSDPYQPARRPPREFQRDDRFPRGRGFTVTLDPDVARVFRGDASVNRALRLVLQLMQVVQGPPVRGERPARGYQGTPQARGFTRKPRFEEEDESKE